MRSPKFHSLFVKTVSNSANWLHREASAAFARCTVEASFLGLHTLNTLPTPANLRTVLPHSHGPYAQLVGMLMHSRNPLAAGRQARPPHSHVQCVHSSLWKAPASRCCVAYATSPVSQATTAESSQVDGLGHLDGAIADG